MFCFVQITKSHCDIPLVNPSIFHNSNDETDDDVWRILKLDKTDSDKNVSDIFVVFSSTIFHVVRPFAPEVLASCSGLRSLNDLAVTDGEIFVLEGKKKIIAVGQFNVAYLCKNLIRRNVSLLLSYKRSIY